MPTLYRYSEPTDPYNDDWTPITITLSTDQILDEYYTYWSTRMLKVNKLPNCTEANCIDDWAVIHWAFPVQDLQDFSPESVMFKTINSPRYDV